MDTIVYIEVLDRRVRFEMQQGNFEAGHEGWILQKIMFGGVYSVNTVVTLFLPVCILIRGVKCYHVV